MPEQNDPTQAFDFFGECLNSGNRADRERMGTGDDDDWYSWIAFEIPQLNTGNVKNAFIDVYNSETGHKRLIHVTWSEVDPNC